MITNLELTRYVQSLISGLIQMNSTISVKKQTLSASMSTKVDVVIRFPTA